MVKAYVLGDKILDTKFQDTCIDGIIESTDKPEIPPEFRFHPTGEAIEYVYNNTCESAPIGKLFVNMYAIQGTRMWLSGWKDSSRIPRQFLLDLSFTLMSRRGKAHSYHVALRPWEYHTGETSDDDLVSEDESLCSECAAKFEIE